jgi:hypothetical protein
VLEVLPKEELAALISSNPDFKSPEFVAKLLKPAKEFGFKTADKQLFRTDPATGTATPVGGTPPGRTRGPIVVDHDNPLNERFGLGIPKGKNARVELTLDANGEVIGGAVKGAFGGSGVTIVDKAESEFDKAQGKRFSETIGKVVDAGITAKATQQTLVQLADLFAEGVPTGRFQDATLKLRGFAQDLGVNLDAVSEGLGIKLGAISKQEEVERLTTRLVISGFEKFKGNLNKEEVRIALAAFADLGRDEASNISALAAGLAAAQVARERAIPATNIGSQADAAKFVRKMLEEDPDAARFLDLKEGFERELTQAFAESAPAKEKFKADRIATNVKKFTPEAIAQITTREELEAVSEAFDQMSSEQQDAVAKLLDARGQ